MLIQAAQELKGIAGDMKYELDEQGVAEGQVNELSGDLLKRAALVAKNKSDKAMDPKIHDALGGGYMNPLAKHYNTVSDKFSNKAAKVGQRDAAKNKVVLLLN